MSSKSEVLAIVLAIGSLLAPRSLALVAFVTLGLSRMRQERAGYVLISFILLVMSFVGLQTFVLTNSLFETNLRARLYIFFFPDVLLALVLALVLWRPATRDKRFTPGQRGVIAALMLTGIGWGCITINLS